MRNKLLTASVAAVMALGSLGAATTAAAQARPGHPAAHAQARPGHAPTRAQPPQVRPAPAQAPSMQRWQRSSHRYQAPRYVAPRGYQARTWSYGQRMPSAYRTRTYVVNDYGRYGLRAPPRGYQYVRSGDDVVLAAVATGLIAAVIAGLFN